MSESVNLTVAGTGHAELIVGDERVYVHRLAAVAEHGTDAIDGKDVHHVHHWDGEPCKWVNNPELLEPENSEEHRTWNLNNQPHAAD